MKATLILLAAQLVQPSLSLAARIKVKVKPEYSSDIYYKLLNENHFGETSLKKIKEKFAKRIEIFTDSYPFSKEALTDVRVYPNSWSINVTTKNGNIRFYTGNHTKQLEFQSFESEPILNMKAFKEVEVTRQVEGRSWAPSFGAAVIPSGVNSRTGETIWAPAVYAAPTEGYKVIKTVKEKELREFMTDGYFRVVKPDVPYRKDLAQLDIHMTPLAGRTNPQDMPALATLYSDKGDFVYAEIQQVNSYQAHLLAVQDTGEKKLVGQIYEVDFTDTRVQVRQHPLYNSRVYVDRDIFGLDLPSVKGSSSSRAGKLIEE